MIRVCKKAVETTPKIATYSSVGAQFGYGMLWTMPFAYPFMTVIQEISARIGRVTGHGIAANMRDYYPRSTFAIRKSDSNTSRTVLENLVD